MKKLALLSSVLFVVMVTSAAATPPEPNHWWELDETSGTTAYDSVGNADGIFNGDDPCWADGLIGGAIDCNGINDYFSVPSLDNAYPAYYNTFSVAGWFKTSQSTGMQTIVGVWNNYMPAPNVTIYFGWQVLVENNKVVARFGPAGLSEITGTRNVNDGNWHHFAMVYPNQNSNTVLYVDGQPEGTPQNVYGYSHETKFRIGDGSYVSHSDGTPVLKGGPFNGMIDDVMVFDGVLTAEEVLALASDFRPWRVDWFDLAHLAAHWLDTPCAEPDWCEGADTGRDGIVNFIDYAYLAEDWLADDVHPAEPALETQADDPPTASGAIYTCDQLQAINGRRGVENGNYYLANDIDFQQWNDEGKQFVPIGFYNGNPYEGFSGTLDGQGHTIRNLHINMPWADCVGLFSCLNGGAQIKNLGLVNVNITGRYYTGGLVGQYNSSYWYDDGSEISNCYVTGNIMGTYYSTVGGLVGRLVGGKIKQSYSYSNVSGNLYAGGLIGLLSFGEVFDCYARGKILGGNPQLYAGGLAGYSSGEVTNSYSTVKILSNQYAQIGGLISLSQNLGAWACNNSFWDMETSGLTQTSGGTGKTTLEMKTQSTFEDVSWDFGIWGINPAINDGYPYLFGTKPVKFYDVWYVDDNAEIGGNGRTWETAFKYLQDAFNKNPYLIAGDEIWVAQGTYKPDEGDGITPGDKTATFQLIDSITAKGGYAGIGAANPDDRDMELYPTILSGDLSSNDLHDFPYLSNTEDNSCHILKGAYDAILDGFTIEGGYARMLVYPNPYDPWWAIGGAGMYNKNCSPIIKNCTFQYNKGYNSGGAIVNISSSPQIINCKFINNVTDIGGKGGGAILSYNSNSQIQNCIFIDNQASRAGGTNGGAIYSRTSTNEITNCVFSNNNTGYGGAIYNCDASTTTVTNCIIAGNIATRDGGGISNWHSNVTVINSTITKNQSGYRGGGVFNLGSTSSATLINSIIWDNIDNYAGNDEVKSAFDTNSVNISYCDIKGSSSSWSDSYFGINGGGNVDADPLFVDINNPLDQGLRLRTGSLCIDAANDSCAPATDILGQERVDIPGNGSSIADMGVYEKKAPRIWYVDSNAVDTIWNGTSWETPFKYLQDALAAANVIDDEIRVARGIYKPDQDKDHPDGTGDRTATFQLINVVSVKGGYKGGDNLTGDRRNTKTYKTILSGDLSSNDSNPPDFATYGDNSYHVATGGYYDVALDAITVLDATTVLDGFTITGGNADGPWPYERGAGLCTVNSNPTISNCVFSYNKTPNAGGAVFSSFYGDDSELANYQSTLKFTNCIFYNNSAEQFGGGIFHGNSSIELVNCVFADNNVTSGYGGGISLGFVNSSHTAKLTNCTFYDNSSGIWNCETDSIITNCIFWNNGNEITNSSSNPIVTYCDVQGGYTGTGNINADPLFTNTALIEGVDGIFITSDDGLRLSANSPCIDSANGDIAPLGDILGYGRVDIDSIPNTGTGNPNYADMGAYECRGSGTGCSDLTIVMCFIDETQEGYIYYGPDLFYEHLSAYRDSINGINIKSICLVPGGSIQSVLPGGYTYDPYDPPEGIIIELFPRPPVLTDFQYYFNNLRGSCIPTNVILCVDNSGSMRTDVLEPAYSQFKEWIAAEYPGTNVYTDGTSWGDELWVGEITRMIEEYEISGR